MPKTRLIDGGWFQYGMAILFTVVMLVSLIVFAKSTRADETPTGYVVGDVLLVWATCNAYGANEVAKADLLTGAHEGGNYRFMQLARADSAHCSVSIRPVQLKIREIVYMGASGKLHVSILKFDDGVFVVITGPHPDPDPGPGLAVFSL